MTQQLKALAAFAEDFGFDSQHLLGDSQHSLTPVRGERMTSSGLHGQQVCMHAKTCMYPKHPTHKIKKKNKE